MSDLFQVSDPGLPGQWRAIILFGRNVASYKFALAAALLDRPSSAGDLVSLEELAEPFALHICRHLQEADKQATSPGSRFLDACRAYNRGELPLDDLRAATVRLGFQNVIDAFHVVGASEVPSRFFLDERRAARGIRLTDAFHQLRETTQAENLPHETEARWRLVETAWQLDLPSHLLRVGYDASTELLVDPRRRKPITRVRPALNGYQRGRCFYCAQDLAIGGGSGARVDVDHVIPRFLLLNLPPPMASHVDGVWNLVLACDVCNRGAGGKFGRLPSLALLERLYHRNEALIGSHHPLRETLIAQTGATPEARRTFLQAVYQAALDLQPSVPWDPPRDLVVGR